jgi:hypothetical protein
MVFKSSYIALKLFVCLCNPDKTVSSPTIISFDAIPCFAYLVTSDFELKYKASNNSNKIQVVCFSIIDLVSIWLFEFSMKYKIKGDIGYV